MARITHPFHPHELSLILRNENNESAGTKNACRVCRQEIVGSSYGCRGCSFYLHKICAELPQEYQRTVTRRGDEEEHDLVLRACSPTCSECQERTKSRKYYCTWYEYSVCVWCASRERIVDHNCHEHGLRPILTSAVVSCDACREKHEGHSYMCLSCRFWIHEDCASLPVIIKLREHHPHPLVVSYSSPIKNLPGEFSCGICKQNLNKKSWLYLCKPCGFYVHPTCPANIGCEIVDNFADAEEASLINLPKDEETDHLFLKFVKQLAQGDDNREIKHNETELIEKFGYQLTLKREEEGLSTNKKCIACLFPISNVPFYGSCSDADIFLHEWCAKLPSELQHPGHPHKLNLHGERKILRCSNCQCASEGFKFQCGVCKNYCLDVKCASLPTVIKHEVHKQHPLSLSEDCLDKSQHCVACNRKIDEFSFGCSICDVNCEDILDKSQHCVACNRKIDEFSYGCSICNVNLHYTCALLPLKFKHRYDEHPFILNYRPIENDEYYCEICKEDIDPKWWFYDCKEYRQSVCVRCMWEDKKPFPHIPNWVRTYVYETHPHPLQLVSLRWWRSLNRCDRCGRVIMDNLVYGCEFEGCEGKKFHRKCMKGYRIDSARSGLDPMKRILYM